MMIQAMSWKGCVEHDSNEMVEQDSRQQFFLTLLVLVLLWLCKWTKDLQ